MKFWKKIFLYSVSLTMILINSVGILMIENIHKRNFDRAIIDTIDYPKNIVNYIYLNYDITYLSHDNPYSYRSIYVFLILQGIILNIEVNI